MPATYLQRAAAAIVDWIIIVFIVSLADASMFQKAHKNGTFSFQVHGESLVVAAVVAIIYFAVCEHVWGKSVAKAVFGIKVLGTRDALPTWSQSITRSVLRILDVLPVFLPYLVGFLVGVRDPEKRRLGDRVAGTRVVKDR